MGWDRPTSEEVVVCKNKKDFGRKGHKARGSCGVSVGACGVGYGRTGGEAPISSVLPATPQSHKDSIFFVRQTYLVFQESFQHESKLRIVIVVVVAIHARGSGITHPIGNKVIRELIVVMVAGGTQFVQKEFIDGIVQNLIRRRVVVVVVVVVDVAVVDVVVHRVGIEQKVAVIGEGSRSSRRGSVRRSRCRRDCDRSRRIQQWDGSIGGIRRLVRRREMICGPLVERKATMMIFGIRRQRLDVAVRWSDGGCIVRRRTCRGR